MFTKFRDTLKAFVLDTRSTPARLVIDHMLRHQAEARIALTDPSRVNAAIRVPLQTELEKILNFSTEFQTELYVRRFEADFAKLCGRRFAVGTHSGTSALQLSLVALGIGPGDEVVTAANTYIATALAISNAGATPVFVDVQPATFNMDPAALEAAITPRTKAVVPVHLYGQMANMTEILAIAARNGVKVIEDACQAFGAELNGRKAGSLGDAGCFSFSTSKNLSGLGNGGIVVADDKSLIEKIRSLRNPEANEFGIRRSHRTPCYLDAIQIAFIRAKLPFVEAWISVRRAQACQYRKTLLRDGLWVPAEAEGARHVYYRFAVRSPHGRRLKEYLQMHGIRTATAYTPCLHLTRTYSDLGYARGAFPVAEAAASDTLLLPISPFLRDPELQKVSRTILRFYDTHSL